MRRNMERKMVKRVACPLPLTLCLRSSGVQLHLTTILNQGGASLSVRACNWQRHAPRAWVKNAAMQVPRLRGPRADCVMKRSQDRAQTQQPFSELSLDRLLHAPSTRYP